MIYDKREEMRQRGYDVECYPARVMRCEQRFMNGSKVKSVLGGQTVETLWREYSNLGAIFNDTVRQSLFRNPLLEADSFTGGQIEKEMRAYKTKYPRNWHPKYLQDMGAYNAHSGHLSETYQQAFTRVIDDEGGSESTNRQRLHRARRDAQKAVLNLTALRRSDTSARTLGALHRELESKLLPGA